MQHVFGIVVVHVGDQERICGDLDCAAFVLEN